MRGSWLSLSNLGLLGGMSSYSSSSPLFPTWDWTGLINRLDSLRSPGINGSPAFPSPHLSPGMGLVKDRAEERGLFEHDIDGLMIHDPLS